MQTHVDSNGVKAAKIALKLLSAYNVDDADISLSSEKGFSVTARSGDVETIEHHLEKSLSVTVYQNHCTGSASCSDFSKVAIEQTIEKALSIAKFAQKDPFSGLPDPSRLAKAYPDCDLMHAWDLAPEKALSLALDCEALALDNAKIKQSEGVSVSSYFAEVTCANTRDFIGSFQYSEHAMGCSLIAKSGDQMQREHEYTVARVPTDLLSYDILAQRAVDKTLSRLDARPIPTQVCPVIFDAPIAKSLISAFVRAISGPSLYRRATFLLDAMGQPIFPSFVNIYQQPHLKAAMGSAPFDGEGVLTEHQNYIESGQLVRYMLGSYSARKLNLATTGNAGGVYNLTIDSTGESFEALLEAMGTGLLVTSLMGQGINITTGDYSRGASGFWVENGQIQFPVEEITIAGNLKDMFLGIQAVASDIDIRSSIRTGSILVNKVTVAGN